MDRFDPGAEHLGQVSPAVDTEPDDGRGHRRQLHTELRQPEIDDEELRQHRYRAKHIYIECPGGAQ
jgi:hypothetical protein